MAEYGYRYYMAALGRWLGRDPLSEAGGTNLYGFVSNGGVNQWDVLGLEESPWGSYDPASPKFDPTSYEVGDQFLNDACGRRWAFKARLKRWFRLSDNPQNRCCGNEWSIAGTEGNKIWAEAGRQHAEDESRRKHAATFGTPEDTIEDQNAALIAEAERRASNPLGLDPQNVAAVSKGLKQSAVTTVGVLANIAMAIDTGGVLGEISAAKAAIHSHHPLPKFLGGDTGQLLSKLESKVHTEFHQLLRQNLKAAGIPLDAANTSSRAWQQYMLANPGAQRTAFDSVLNASRAIDTKYGTQITQDVWKNVMPGNFSPYP